MLCPWLGPGTSQARHEQEPSRAAEEAALCVPAGKWQGTLSSPAQVAFTDPPWRAFRRKHPLTAAGGGVGSILEEDTPNQTGINK